MKKHMLYRVRYDTVYSPLGQPAMSCLLCIFLSPSRTVLHKRCLNKQMRTKGWGDRGPERIRTGQQLEDALGTGRVSTLHSIAP